MFIIQRILAAAQPGQEDTTAAGIPTLQGLGGAISAALAGLAGNAMGLDLNLSAKAVQHATLAMFGGGAVIAFGSVLMSLHFVRSLACRTH